MATRSSITVKTGENEYKSVYCHFDGYPTHHAPILLNHYNNMEKVLELISMGDMSILGERIHPTNTNNHTFDGDREKGVCLFYGRDRGETGIEAKTYYSLNRLRVKEEFNYYFDGEAWYLLYPKGMKRLDKIMVSM